MAATSFSRASTQASANSYRARDHFRTDRALCCQLSVAKPTQKMVKRRKRSSSARAARRHFRNFFCRTVQAKHATKVLNGFLTNVV